jgi:leucyl aminopeptidase
VPGEGADVVASLGIDAAGVLRSQKATGAAGELVVVPVAGREVQTVVFVGVGDGSLPSLRRAASALARRSASASSMATTLAHGCDIEGLRAIAEAIGLASYSVPTAASAEPKALTEVTLVVDRPAQATAALDATAAVVDAVSLARDLVNTPSLVKTPRWMADRAVDIAARAGLEAEVWDERRLAIEGFGGVLAVGRASARPPCLVRLTYAPDRAERHVVLVGKGITFDSGGLSLKPLDGMTAMKTDMAGGAAAIATMSALGRLGATCAVTALVPLAENLVGGDANRPGDVIRHYGGTTVEVLNTDAEGRLVLADALAYATTRLRPDAVVDLATLTGAATLGLGRGHGALFCTSDELRDELVEAATAGGERLWPMPLVDDYRDCLDSPIADLRNIGDPAKSYGGGSIVAALFLREFVATTPWAHLDIAGPARADGDDGELTKGGTGFGVRTLLRWLAPQTSR